jgi:isopenicillin N synthase-like dioxygenase
MRCSPNRRTFFAQPAALKEQLSVANSTQLPRLRALGEEKLDPALAGDVKECFNAGPISRPDDPDVLAGKPYHAVNQWPDSAGLPADADSRSSDAALELVVLLHRAIAVDLGIDERYFDQYFTHAVGVLRLLHYPPHPGPSTATSTARARTPITATSRCSRRTKPAAWKCASATATGSSFRPRPARSSATSATASCAGPTTSTSRTRTAW